MKAALLCAVLLAGCASSGPRESDRYFILDTSGSQAPGAPVAVQVAPTTASAFYDTQSIVYSRTPGTRAYYQFNYWTERPQGAIHKALSARLGPGGQGELLVLRTHLEEIYHDASAQPGTARIAITAQLVDPSSRAVLAQRVFSRAMPAASFDASGAVHGLRQALGALLDDLAVWVDAERASRK
jgi:cholesterol transport system auxiliary component